MRCPSCSADNAATRRFCAKCRAPLPSPCLACGFENELGAQFCGGCGKPVGEAAAPTRPAAPLRPRTDDAERRQLTVMFCDLVGSTVPSARLDPEDLRAVIGTYHRCCAGVIERGGGLSPGTWGTGCSLISATRGQTRTMPNARYGARPVETAAVPETAASDPPQVRVGIATGLVVVGDLPRVRGLTLMVNSIFNGNRFEDLRIEE